VSSKTGDSIIIANNWENNAGPSVLDSRLCGNDGWWGEIFLVASGTHAPHGYQISLVQKYELWFDKLTTNGKGGSTGSA